MRRSRRPIVLRPATGGSSGPSLLTLDDLTWQGGYRVPSNGSAGVTSGSAVGFGSLAVRYTASTPPSGTPLDDRRFLIPHFTNVRRNVTSVTAANPCVVTTSGAHGFVTGEVYYHRFVLHDTTEDTVAGTAAALISLQALAVTVLSSTTYSVAVDTSGSLPWTGLSDGGVRSGPRSWGDLVEYCIPAATPAYTGAAWETSAPSLLEVRRWPSYEWASPFHAVGDYDSGNQVGGMWWDEAQGLLWVSMYGYYSTNNQPALMAVSLGNSTHGTLGGNYKTVSAVYGPWYYRSSVAGGAHTEWKGINHGFIPVPSSAQSDLGGRAMIRCGAVGAVGGTGHLGLGLRALNLPSTGLAANAVMESTDNAGLGLKLAEYSEELALPAGMTHANARRPGNYTRLQFTGHMDGDTGLWSKTGSGDFDGYWQMSMDQTNGAVWVETSTKHGVISFGRQVSGGTAYGYNPLSATQRPVTSITHSGTTATMTLPNHFLASGVSITIQHATPSTYNGTFTATVVDSSTLTFTLGADPGSNASWDGTGGDLAITCVGWSTSVQPDNVDPGRAYPGPSNGYSGEAYTGVLRIMDPAAIRAVALGASPYNDNINWSVSSDIYAKWPNLPMYSSLETDAPGTRVNQLSVNTHGMYWDATASTVAWCIASSAADDLEVRGFTPTLQFFAVP